MRRSSLEDQPGLLSLTVCTKAVKLQFQTKFEKAEECKLDGKVLAAHFMKPIRKDDEDTVGMEAQEWTYSNIKIYGSHVNITMQKSEVVE